MNVSAQEAHWQSAVFPIQLICVSNYLSMDPSEYIVRSVPILLDPAMISPCFLKEAYADVGLLRAILRVSSRIPKFRTNTERTEILIRNLLPKSFHVFTPPLRPSGL